VSAAEMPRNVGSGARCGDRKAPSRNAPRQCAKVMPQALDRTLGRCNVGPRRAHGRLTCSRRASGYGQRVPLTAGGVWALTVRPWSISGGKRSWLGDNCAGVSISADLERANEGHSLS
jgi:hypothetical protein